MKCYFKFIIGMGMYHGLYAESSHCFSLCMSSGIGLLVCQACVAVLPEQPSGVLAGFLFLF